MVNWFIYISSFLFLVIVLFLIYFIGNRENLDISELKSDEEYLFFENSHGKTAYYSIGSDEGEPLILIHGVTVPYYYYKKIQEVLN